MFKTISYKLLKHSSTGIIICDILYSAHGRKFENIKGTIKKKGWTTHMATNKNFTIKLGIGYDAEIIGKLESVKNKSAYIKDLIRRDMSGELSRVESFTDDTESAARQYSSITEEKYKDQFDINGEKTVSFPVNIIKDNDIIEKMNALENKSEYIRNLILADLELINSNGDRFFLPDENGNLKSEKRTISEKRKEAQRKYNKRVSYNAQFLEESKNKYKIRSVSFKIEEDKKIDSFCAENDIKRNTLIRTAVMKYIDEFKNK